MLATSRAKMPLVVIGKRPNDSPSAGLGGQRDPHNPNTRLNGSRQQEWQGVQPMDERRLTPGELGGIDREPQLREALE